MADINKFLDRQPKWLKFLIGFAFVAILGYVDILTGEYSLFLFYLVPIAFVVWYVGCWQGISIAVLSGFARYLTDSMFNPRLGLLYWNSTEDMLFLVIDSILIYVIKRSLRA